MPKPGYISDNLSMFVVYERPEDYPEHFIVRRWEVVGPVAVPKEMVGEPVNTLEEARALVHRGAGAIGIDPVMTTRSPEDPPCIREVWL